MSPASGYTLEGKVTHAEKRSPYTRHAPDAVERSLFMDETLYTVSKRSVIMTDLADGDRINEVFLPYRWEVYPTPYPVW